MKKIIRMFTGGLVSLMMFTGLTQAQDMATVNVVQGKKAKMTMISQLKGFGEVLLSRNEKYAFGGISGETSIGYIYEISSGKLLMVEDGAVKDVIDFNNYLTDKYIVRDGKKVDMVLPETFEFEDVNTDYTVFRLFGYIGANYSNIFMDADGKVIDTLEPHWPGMLESGYGSMGLGMNDDASVVAGRSSAPFAFSNFSPVFWDRQTGKSYFVGEESSPELADGTLYGVNKDGSIIVGDIGQIAHVIHYDRANGTFTKTPINPSIGHTISYAFSVSEDNIVLGVDQPESTDVYGRVPFLYFIETGEKVTLNDYLLNLYGLDAEASTPLMSFIGFSDSSRIITGYSYEDAAWLPVVIELEKDQIHPLVRDLKATQLRETQTVRVEWTAPMKGQYTLKGYDVYCDSVKINTEMLSVGTTSFDHFNAPSGIHHYQVKAVYTDNIESDYPEPVKIFVIEVGGCLPIQEMTSSVTYNRFVRINWGLPSSDMDQKSSLRNGFAIQLPSDARLLHQGGQTTTRSASAATSTDEVLLEYVDVMNTKAAYPSAVARVGNYFYVGQFMSNKLAIYDVHFGKLVTEVDLANVPGIYDMSYHDGKLYTVSNDQYVRVLDIDPDDPMNVTLSNQFKTKEQKLVHITYVDQEDGQLLLGGYFGLYLYGLNPIDEDDLAGDVSRFDLEGMVISGSAYHDGKLYLADQGGESLCGVKVFDWESGELLRNEDLAELSSVQQVAAGGDIAVSGMSVSTLSDSTRVLDIILQPLYDFKHILTMEIESSPNTVGYNLYRNGEKIASLLPTRHYVDTIDEAGSYKYTVEYVSTQCSSNSSSIGVSQTVQIFDKGICYGPSDLKVYESNRQSILSWDIPEENTTGSLLVGFNVYRDGILLSEELLDQRFVDAQVEKGEHIYVVEAYYDNSCLASDSVEIEITHEGTAQAPSAVKVKESEGDDHTWTVTTTWDLPYFEEPMAMGYCNLPYSALDLSDADRTYALIGWDSAGMKLFDDLYLVGMEFMIGDEVKTLNGIVFIDNQLVHNEVMTDRIRVGEWNTMMFNQAYPMKQQLEIALGYAISFDPETSTTGHIVFDMGPGKRGYSDIISPDGGTWYYLADNGVDANLCINALVVRKRDLEKAAMVENPQEYLASRVVSLEKLAMTQPSPVANNHRTTSESYTLKGFNVYRDDVKVNDTLLTSFSYDDMGLTSGEYAYSVSAVYQDDEVISEPIYIYLEALANEASGSEYSMNVYPNPVIDYVNVVGEYVSLDIYSASGNKVMSYGKGNSQVSMRTLTSGVYFLHFNMGNGQVRVVKVVKK